MSAPAVRASASLIVVSPTTTISNCGFNYRILLVRRSSRAGSSFTNATVFPGGNVDAADGIDGSEESYKYCALRETFEETGVLLSKHLLRIHPDELNVMRSNVVQNASKFKSLLSSTCNGMRIAYDLNTLKYIANWITPPSLPKRYNTRFYLKVLEEGSNTLSASHDSGETVEIFHYTPQEALNAVRHGQIIMFPPQYYIISELSRFATWQDVAEWAKVIDSANSTKSHEIKQYMPQQSKDRKWMLLPGDEARRDETALPGSRNRVCFEMTKLGPSTKGIERRNVQGLLDLVRGKCDTSAKL